MMNLFEVIILSVTLALDAMLVSFSYGLILNVKKLYNSLCLSISFGVFQFLMPVIGWKLTGYIYNYLETYSKWIVFFVFLLLGVKFLKEAFSKTEKVKVECISCLCIIFLAVATSIDAFGAGVSIRFLNAPILFISFLIGIITFILSFTGFYAAGIFRTMKAEYVETAGALLLIYLAVKSLY